MLSILFAVPSCLNMVSSLHPTSFLMILSLIFLCRPSLDSIVARGGMNVRACLLCARIPTEVVTCTCTQRRGVGLNGNRRGGLLSESQTLPKGTSRTKIGPSHVKIMVFRPEIRPSRVKIMVYRLIWAI